MTLLFARTPRRPLLIGLMGIFTLGNFLSAIAGDYGTLLGARVVTSLNHGAFFGVGAVVAASVVTTATALPTRGMPWRNAAASMPEKVRSSD